MRHILSPFLTRAFCSTANTLSADTKLIVAEETGVGKAHPFSVEKLSPILALYTVESWREASELSSKLLAFGGLGHTFGIHAKDEQVIEHFGLTQPASRIVVNSGTTFGGIGATTGIQPSLTLGCGSFGGNATSDNIGPQHLMNVKRVAFGVRELQSYERAAPAEQQSGDSPAAQWSQAEYAADTNSFSKNEVIAIIKQVLQEMKG